VKPLVSIGRMFDSISQNVTYEAIHNKEENQYVYNKSI